MSDAESTGAGEWRDAPSYPGYQASRSGLVRSVDRVLSDGRTAGGMVLKASPDRDGYLRVTVSGRKVPVHYIVMDAWIGPCPEGMERLHGNSDNQDNRVTNLRFGTHLENEQDKRQRGRKNIAESGCPSSVVTSNNFRNRSGASG